MSTVNEKNLVLTRAQGAVIARDFQTAARLYKQLLKDDPSNVDYLREIGAIYVKAGEDEKAIPYYEQIITFYPHYIDAMNSLGAIFRRLHRYEESVEILQRAQDEGRQSHDVNYNLGFTYKEMGNYDDAIDAFELVIGENPSDVLAHNHLGNIYLAKKQYPKAVSAFKRGLQIDQNHPILNYNLARCYQEAKMYNDAIRYYEQSLRVKPGWSDAIKDYSDLLIKCQKTKEASDLVRHSIELHPNDSKMLSILGKIYLEQYDYEGAAKVFKRANSVDDKNVAILSGLAEALEKSEKPGEALEVICQAVELEPNNKDVKKQYVHTLLSVEDFDAAQVNVDELYVESEGSDPQVLDLYGQYCICVDDEVKASEYFGKINQINRQYKDYLLSAAGRYAQKGNYVQAERFAKDFVAKNVQNPAGYNMLGSIYSKNGNYESAIDSYNKSQNLKKPNILAEKQIQNLTNMLQKQQEVEEEEKPEEASVQMNEDLYVPAPAQETADTEEEFDFGSMGDNVPMGEALLEEENDFFDDLDKELDIEPSLEPEDNMAMPAEETEAETEKPSVDSPFADSIDSKSDRNPMEDSFSPFENDKPLEKALDFDDADDISPFQDFEKDEPKSQAEQLVPDADFSGDEDFYTEPENTSSAGEDEIDPFDMFGSTPSADDDFNKPSYPDNSNSGYGNAGERPSADFSDSGSGDGAGMGDSSDFGKSPFDSDFGGNSGLSDDFGSGNQGFGNLDSGLGNNGFGNSNSGNGFGGSDSDSGSNGFGGAGDSASGTGSSDFAAPENDFASPSQSYNPFEDYRNQNAFAQEMERKAHEAARESARYAMDAAMDAQKLVSQLAGQHEELKEKLAALDNEIAEVKQNNSQPVEQVIEPSVEVPEPPVEEEIPFENYKTPVDPQADSELFDSDFGNEAEYENDISPETEEAFNYDDYDDFGDELLGDTETEPEAEMPVDASSETEVPAEEISEETPVEAESVTEDEDSIPEIDSTYEAETLNQSSLVQPMEDSGFEDSIIEDEAMENEAEIELFKKLRSLCDFVPDSERQTNNYGNMRTRIEYIISKMSGKPGLLKVAEEYADEIEDFDINYGEEPDSKQIMEVLEIMKSLAASLEDQSVAVTLCAKADELIDKIISENF